MFYFLGQPQSNAAVRQYDKEILNKNRNKLSSQRESTFCSAPGIWQMHPRVYWCLKRLAFALLAAILIAYMVNNFSILQYTKSHHIRLRQRALSEAQEKKLYMRLVSRMGNHHFQIATLIALAAETGRTPILTSGSGYDIFMLYPDMTIPVIESVTVKVQTIHENRSVSFTHHLVDDIMRHPDDVKICCFFESWQYFLAHEKDVRRELSISKEIRDDVNSHLWTLVTSLGKEMEEAAHHGDVVFVGVHVRRGDKLKSAYGFNIAPLTYFQNSIRYFRRKFKNHKLVFVVTSDDRKWVRDNIKGSNITFSELQNPYEDFALLTICNHTISSVGTFSWWASFLAGGEVLYYKYPTLPGTLKHSRFHPKDYYLPHWIPYE